MNNPNYLDDYLAAHYPPDILAEFDDGDRAICANSMGYENYVMNRRLQELCAEMNKIVPFRFVNWLVAEVEKRARAK